MTWDETLGRAALFIRSGRFDEAILCLSSFIEVAEAGDDRRSALEMRASVYQLAGDRSRARQDLETAYEQSRPAQYSTYVTEIALGNMARDDGDAGTAKGWYLAALKTALAGEGIATGAALEGLIEVTTNRELDDAERQLVWAACHSSWRVLGLGEPIPSELSACVSAILDAQRT